jgi:hypothetical protein
VIATAEFPADLGQGARRQPFGEVHGDLARPCDGQGAAARGHLGHLDVLGDAAIAKMRAGRLDLDEMRFRVLVDELAAGP